MAGKILREGPAVEFATRYVEPFGGLFGLLEDLIR